ncbi:MAG: hemolysin activation/secretion protein [Zhongshania sp.]
MIQRTAKEILLIYLVLIFSSSQLLAANADDINDAARQLQRIQQEQQLKQQLQYEEDLKSSKPPANLDQPIEEIKPSIPSVACKDIDEIKLVGLKKLTLKDVKSIVKRYQLRCLNVSDIEQLMAEVTAIYIQKGYITSRVYLAEQDLKDGILILQVLEGELEKVEVKDNDAKSISVFNVFPGKVGEPLNLRDIEQAVDQINRLQSNNVTMSIAPGTSGGESILILENQIRKPWKINSSYDNYGSKSTGKEQGSLNFSFDNPLGFNDFLSLTYNRTIPYDGDKKGSESSSLTYVVPFGYNTLSLNGSRSKYSSPLNLESGAVLISSGRSGNLSLRLDRSIFRDKKSKWNVSSSITNKETKSYIGGEFLSISSRELSILDVDSTYTHFLSKGIATLTFGYAKGVDWFGSLDDPSGLPSIAPQAQFGKWKYGASYSSNFRLKKQPVSISSRLAGQYSHDVLYGSEALLIGGIYTVRGFSSNSLSGESGFYWRNDITLPLKINPIAGFASSLRVYMGLDHGRIINNSLNVPEGSLTGAAVGVTLSIASLNIDVYTSKALNKPSYMPDESYISYFRLSISI